MRETETAAHPNRESLSWRELLLLVSPVLLTLLQTAAGMLTVANPQPLSRLSALAVSWTLVIPLVVMTARRVPVARDRLGRAVLLLLLASAVISTLQQSIRLGILIVVDERLTSFTPRFVLLSAVGSSVVCAAMFAIHQTLDYHRRYEASVLESARLQAELRTAQLRTLQSQVQPHFLFNTLNVASHLVTLDPPRAHEVLVGLSDLLRRSLTGFDHPQVPLAEEIDFLERYLAIESARLGDRLRVAFRVDEQVLSAAVPSLSLQPLVENAIRHGINRRPEGGRIEIRAFRRADTLVLEVADDGVGLPDDRMPDERSGIGLANIRERLRRWPGGGGELQLVPASPGLVARICLPLHKAGPAGREIHMETAP